jgi:Bacterial sugar transferase
MENFCGAPCDATGHHWFGSSARLARSNDTRHDIERRVTADLEYINSWSISLDLKILLQTIGVILHHNAFWALYPSEHRTLPSLPPVPQSLALMPALPNGIAP